MKKTLLLILLLVIASSSFAQFNLSWAGFTGKDADQIATKRGSQAHFFIPLEQTIKLSDSLKFPIYIEPGIKGTWFRFKENLIASREDGVTNFAEDIDPAHEYKTGFFRSPSTMSYTSLDLTISIPIKPNKDSKFTFSPGFYGSYTLSGSFNRRYKEDGEKVNVDEKFKDEQGFFGVSRWQYGFKAAMYFNYWGIYATYSLNPLFEPNEGPDVATYYIGFSTSYISRRMYRLPGSR